MKHITLILALFAALGASAQQVNPVPDYVFRNQMSVGRNAVTDTAAYFSIGPRYGATKGFMPPIVGDTATFSSGKRNGLLIFSVQKNKFLYWDSVRVQWSDMAGSSGAYIVAGDTAAMLAPYLRKADTTAMLLPYIRHAGFGLTKSGQSFLVDTLNIATRAWRQKGLDSLAALEVSGSGTTNYVPKFTASTTIGNSLIYDNGSSIGIGSTAGSYYVEARKNGTADIVANSTADNNSAVLSVFNSGGTSGNFAQLRAYGNTTSSTLFGSSTNKMITLFSNSDALMTIGTISGTPLILGTNNTERMRIFANGRVGINTTTDAGYQFDVNGTLRSVNGANFATTSGEVLIGTTTDAGAFVLQASGSSRLYHPTANIGGVLTSFNGNSENYYDADLHTFRFGNGGGPALVIRSNAEVAINNPADAGDYKLQVSGNIYNTGSAVLAATSGNVGVGTASPAVKLDVTVSGGDIAAFRRTDAGSALVQYTNANTTDDIIHRFRLNSGAGNFFDLRYYGTSNYFGVDYGGNTRLAVTNGGNVGIGTASPANNGANTTTLTINGTTQGILQLQNAGTKYFELYASGTDTRFENIAGNDLTFRNGSTVNARITSSGELLINTTSDAGDYKLQVAGNIYNTGSAVLAATSGNVGVGTTTINAKLHVLSATGTAQSLGDWANNIAIIQGASRTGTTAVGGSFATTLSLQSNDDVITAGSGASVGFSAKWNSALYGSAAQFASIFGGKENGSDASLAGYLSFATRPAGGNPTERGRINSAGEWIIDASGTDAGDYKLQVVGNARIGTGKLDIASNTTFGIGVARSGTSEVAGQIYNSNGILYTGVESSAGGQIFSGSSAYAAVIGSGANYPLQFAVNNITRGGFSTSGNLLLGFTTDSYFLKLQVNGSIFTNNQFFGQGANAQLSIDSSTNISPLYVSAHSLTGSSAQGLFYGSTTWNTTGNPSLIDLAITNTASGSDANYIKISDGSNIFRVTKAAEVVTAAPTGGSIRKWKLGEAATVSPTSPNRTIRVEIDGTVYYLHAKTTND